MKMDATPTANALHVTNECPMPESLVVLKSMMLLGVVALMVPALRAVLGRQELGMEVVTAPEVRSTKVAVVGVVVCPATLTVGEAAAHQMAIVRVVMMAARGLRVRPRPRRGLAQPGLQRASWEPWTGWKTGWKSGWIWLALDLTS